MPVRKQGGVRRSGSEIEQRRTVESRRQGDGIPNRARDKNPKLFFLGVRVRRLRRASDERPCALSRLNEPVCLQPFVGDHHRRPGDVESSRQLTRCRQSVLGTQYVADDGALYLAIDLAAQVIALNQIDVQHPSSIGLAISNRIGSSTSPLR